MKKYDGKAVSATLSEEVKQAGQEYPHLEQVYMKVFGKPLPESKKPDIKENGREIYYSASDDDDDDDDANRAALIAILANRSEQNASSYQQEHCDIPLHSKEPVQDTSSCQQNKDWFHREFYTDYDPDDTERAERVARFREHLNELDAFVHG